MAVPAGVIFIHNSTNASIPANWTRETKLDGRFIKGTADTVDPDVEAGAATHTHTSAAHTHAMQSHTHTITIPASTGGGTAGNNDDFNYLAHSPHSHAAFSSGVPSATISSPTSTYSAFSNNPPYYEVVFIKPSDGLQSGVPNSACALIDTSSFPTGWTEVTAMRNKFLKGAATGGDAGGTGGTTTNVHDLTHTHTVSHTHAAATSPATTGGNKAGSDSNYVDASHTHSVSLDAATTAPSDTPALTTAETVEPAYKTLTVIKNETGVNSLPIGIIGMWLGILADIPAGWSEVSGMRDKYLKGSASAATVGATGGSNTHTHASQAHNHLNISHTHTANPASITHVAATFGRNTSQPDQTDACNKVATHGASTVSTLNYNLENGSTTADSSSNEPLNTTVAFIKLDRYPYRGSFIFAML